MNKSIQKAVINIFIMLVLVLPVCAMAGGGGMGRDYPDYVGNGGGDPITLEQFGAFLGIIFLIGFICYVWELVGDRGTRTKTKRELDDSAVRILHEYKAGTFDGTEEMVQWAIARAKKAQGRDS